MTTALTLRATKGAPLTHNEVDANFTAIRDRADATRTLLAVPLNLYVRTDGSDSNTGAANTAGSAFLTIQRAVDEGNKYDRTLFHVQINVAAGTYAGNFTLSKSSGNNGYDFVVVGDVVTPSNVVITGNFVSTRGTVKFDGVKLLNTFGSAGNNGSVEITRCVIDATTIYIVLGYAIIYDVTVQGNVSTYVSVGANGMCEAFSWTVSGTPALSSAFVVAEYGGVLLFYDAPVGAATGSRYRVKTNAVIDTSGGGANFFPGDAVGTAATGGQYV